MRSEPVLRAPNKNSGSPGSPGGKEGGGGGGGTPIWN